MKKRRGRKFVTHIIRENAGNSMADDPISGFVAAIADAGLPVPEEIIPDGKLHRFSTNGRRGDTAGFYALHLDDVPAGHFGCWRNDIRQTWNARQGGKLSRAELDRLRRSMEAEERQRREHKEQRAKVAQEIWEKARPASPSHAYLVRKGIRQCADIRQTDIRKADFFDDESRCGVMRDCLLVPIEGDYGIRSLEAIPPIGKKMLMKNGEVAGNYHIIPGGSDTVYVVEGWGTGASVHAATGSMVIVAFSSSGLLKAAKRIRSEMPGARLVIAGDNDRKPDGSNPGRAAAEAAAEATGADVLLPEFAANEEGSDWNDYQAAHGIDGLRRALERCSGEEDELLSLLEQSKAKHLLASEPPPQAFVVEGLIPEPVAAAIVAPGSTGKSFWLMQLAACVVTGKPFMGQAVERPGSVLMFGAEDSRDEMSRRLHSIAREYEFDGCRLDPEALGEGFYPISLLGQDNRLTVHEGRDIVRHEARISRLIRMAKAIPNLRMIIIDPVSRFRSGDENDNEAATRFVEVLEQIREETGVTVLCAHHSRKGSSGEDVDDIRGASAFVDALRFAATLARPKPGKGLCEDDAKGMVRFSVVKSNYRTDVDEQWMRRGVGGVLKPTEAPARPSRSDDAKAKGEERYQEALPLLRNLVKDKAEAGEALTRNALRDYAGTAGMFRMGDQNLRGVVNRAIEEGKVLLHEDGTLHLW